MFLISLLPVILLVAALVDIILRDSSLVRFLPKIAWVFLVIFLPLIGSILWFALGHDWGERAVENISFGDPRRHERMVRQPPAAPSIHVDTRSTEQQLADLDREIEEYEKQRRIRQLEAEVQQRRAIQPE